MPPTGTVTFLFTDVEGSTGAWEAHPEAMAQALARHDTIVRGAVEGEAGYEFSTAGDSFAAVVVRAADATRAAFHVQRQLVAEVWPEPLVVKVRMGLHTGEAVERNGDYFGPTVSCAARIMTWLASPTARSSGRPSRPASTSLPMQCAAAQAFARPRQAFWALSREAWDGVLIGRAPFVETVPSGQPPRFVKMFQVEREFLDRDLADPAQRQAARQRILDVIQEYRAK